MTDKPVTIRGLIALLLLMQFIHVFDGVMVTPLAPDFATALGFPVSKAGFITSAYAFAAAIAGFIAALFLDRFSRKRALLFCLAGLGLATLACAFAWSLESMIAFRFLAGLFGGPMFGVCMAYASDYVPPNQRGRAMGRLMNAFPLVSILGVPLGLELAHLFTWQAPFYAVVLMAIVGGAIGVWRLPYQPPHIDAARNLRQQLVTIGALLRQPTVWAAYGMSALAMLAGFLLIPHIAPYVMMNLSYPREMLGMLYLAGGVATLLAQYASGWMVDRTSATTVSLIFGVLFMLNLYQGFVLPSAWAPIIVTFGLFMVCLSGRGVASQALASQVPPPARRGAYMGIQGALIQMAMGLGGYISSRIVTTDGALLHNVDTVAWAAIAISAVIPFLFWYVETHVRKRGAH